jgi:hypothetical protein
MSANGYKPGVAHINLVLVTLKDQVTVAPPLLILIELMEILTIFCQHLTEKIFTMVMSLSKSNNLRMNGNTFEIALEAMLEAKLWKQSLVIIRAMEKLHFRPSIQVAQS